MDPNAAIARWEAYCDGLKQSGTRILETAVGLDDIEIAEGLRYLTRLMRSGIERHIEYADPLDPCMVETYNERLKWGMDNPDSIYAMSAVDGRCEYELQGSVGDVPYFNFTSFTLSTQARHVQDGFLNGREVDTDAQGRFVVHVGGAERARNWLRLAPQSNSIMLRETFGNRAAERPMTCRIRYLGGAGPARPLGLADMLGRVELAERFLGKTGQTFLQLAGLMSASVNELGAVDDTLMRAMGADPNYFYHWGAFRLQPDEALLLQLPEVPQCENWGLCLYNHWLESLDYARSTINLNMFTSRANADGSVTLVVCARQPEAGNWLDTQGHAGGHMMLRWTHAVRNVAPLARVVRLDGIDWQQALRRWPA